MDADFSVRPNYAATPTSCGQESEVDSPVPEERIAAIVFINTWGGNPAQITRHLLEEAPNF